MKLIYSLTTASLFGLATMVSAHCNSCEKGAKTCSKETCKKSSCKKEACCDSADTNTFNYSVTGMTCKGCSSKVKKALSEIDGVTTHKVCHKSSSVALTIDPAKTDKSKVEAAINATGFKVAGEKLKIPVTGMQGDICANNLSAVLSSVEGCTVSSVCHKSGHASVIIDNTKTSKKAVIEAINKTRFKTTETKAKGSKKIKVSEAT